MNDEIRAALIQRIIRYTTAERLAALAAHEAHVKAAVVREFGSIDFDRHGQLSDVQKLAMDKLLEQLLQHLR